MRAATRRALRNGFESAAAETVAHDLSQQFSKLFGTFIPPDRFTFNSAQGYWAHDHQDVQRIAGHCRVTDNLTITFGTWDCTLSMLARSGVELIDTRGERNADNDFILERRRKRK